MIAIDYTITIGNLITVGGMAVAAISAVLWQRFKIDTKADQAALMAKADSETVSKLSAAVATKADKKEFEDLRLKIATDYVSTEHLREVEARMAAGFESLAVELRGLRADLLNLYKSGFHGQE